MAHDDNNRGLVRCPACGTHRRRDDTEHCRHCDEAPAPKRRGRGRSALIAAALLGLSAFPAACGDSSSKPDIGAAPAYGIPPIEAGIEAGRPDATPDSGADQQLPAPAYGIPPVDAGTD
ncbi:MAG: hypothetical protein KC503_23980 [Myxococcales bacterium]|nr:hypothetical protein [Myxococcales bacterium]